MDWRRGGSSEWNDQLYGHQESYKQSIFNNDHLLTKNTFHTGVILRLITFVCSMGAPGPATMVAVGVKPIFSTSIRGLKLWLSRAEVKKGIHFKRNKIIDIVYNHKIGWIKLNSSPMRETCLVHLGEVVVTLLCPVIQVDIICVLTWNNPNLWLGCYLSYLSGSAGSRLDSLTLHWECL